MARSANGVDEYWIVDSALREVTVLFREGTAFGEPQPVRSGAIPSRVFPELGIAIDDVFADLPEEA